MKSGELKTRGVSTIQAHLHVFFLLKNNIVFINFCDIVFRRNKFFV